MENLKNISTEELLKEIQNRQKIEAKNAYTEKLFPCIGILDNAGIESLVMIKKPEDIGNKFFGMALRTRYGTAQQRVFYKINISEQTYDIFNTELKAGKFIEVAEKVKALTTFKELPY